MPPSHVHQTSQLLHQVRSDDQHIRRRGPVKGEASITERTALLCALFFTIFYVAPFYLSPTLRTNAVTSRDAPTVIRARVRAVGLTCIACTLLAVYILVVDGHATPIEILRWTGVWPCDPLDVLRVLTLTMVLFTCSLYESIVVDGEWQDWSLGLFKEAVWDRWTGYRNLIVAPASEELVFRALTVPLFLLAGTSPTRIVFTTPLVFGLAHLHHFVGFLQSRTPSGRRLPPGAVVAQGLVISLFQFTYTSLFGFFAAFVFLRTGNLWAIIVSHSFCNHMGLPRLWGRVGQSVPHIPSSQDDGTDNGQTIPSELPANRGVAWTVVYYLLVLVGSYGFYKLLFPLTKSANALAEF